MKKLICLTLALVLTLCACNGASSVPSTSAPVASSQPSEASTAPVTEAIKVAALKGPTAMGMVKLMADDTAGRYAFSIAGAVDEITPKLIQGDIQIAAVPANLASVLYNNTKGQVKVLAINTLGVLYIVENGDSVQSVEDLRGKVIYSAGKGATPEYALNFMLKANGLDPEKDVTIDYKSEHTECAALLTTQPNAIAMLPQPFVAATQMKNDQVRVALDLNHEWTQAQQDTATLVTGVVVARTDFIKKHPQAVADFLEGYRASTEYVNTNIPEAAKLVAALDIVPEPVALKAIPQCNITFIAGEEMQTRLSSYLAVLYDQNPKSVGGVLPDEGFYFKR